MPSSESAGAGSGRGVGEGVGVGSGVGRGDGVRAGVDAGAAAGSPASITGAAAVGGVCPGTARRASSAKSVRESRINITPATVRFIVIPAFPVRFLHHNRIPKGFPEVSVWKWKTFGDV